MSVEIRDDNYHALLCDDCGTEIFVDLNMVMIKDDLWRSVARGNVESEAYCDVCMEARLKREITPADFKSQRIPCNEMWLVAKDNAEVEA